MKKNPEKVSLQAKTPCMDIFQDFFRLSYSVNQHEMIGLIKKQEVNENIEFKC